MMQIYSQITSICGSTVFKIDCIQGISCKWDPGPKRTLISPYSQLSSFYFRTCWNPLLVCHNIRRCPRIRTIYYTKLSEKRILAHYHKAKCIASLLNDNHVRLVNVIKIYVVRSVCSKANSLLSCCMDMSLILYDVSHITDKTNGGRERKVTIFINGN